MFKALAFVSVLITVTYQYPQGYCPSVDSWRPRYLPDTASCRIFYECSNGKAHKFYCPPNTVFDPARDVCARSNGGCRPVNFEIAAVEVAAVEVAADGPHLAKECPQIDGEYPTYLINPKNCSQFYECFHGAAFLEECPKGLNFSPTTLVCELPEVAGCHEEAY